MTRSSRSSTRASAPLAASPAPDPAEPRPTTTAHITLKKKRSLEQVQMCLGVPAPAIDDPARFSIYLLNNMLGGGMSLAPLPVHP